MKKYGRSFVVFLSISLMVIFSIKFNVVAQEVTMPLTIVPIYPENQNPQTRGYFDVNVHSGDELSLNLELSNNTDTEMIVNIEPANAFSSHTGGMLYQKESESPDIVLLDDAVLLADSIQVNDNIHIPPNSTVSETITITVPSTDGQTILGGLLISSKGETIEQTQEVEEGTANFAINTETVFAMAIQLNLPNSTESDFSLGNAGFYGELAQVYIEMTNNAQKIQENIEGSYTVQNETGEVLFNGNFGPFKMAPKSQIRYPIQWGYETLEDGNYILNIQSSGDPNFNELKEFIITSENVEDFVEQTQKNITVAKIDNELPSWIWILVIILFGLVMFFLGRRKTT